MTVLEGEPSRFVKPKQAQFGCLTVVHNKPPQILLQKPAVDFSRRVSEYERQRLRTDVEQAGRRRENNA